MLKLLEYLLNNGVVTTAQVPDNLPDVVTGLPKVTAQACAAGCEACVTECPTDAVKKEGESVSVDLGACIGCNLCVMACPTGTLQNDRRTATYAYEREQLIVRADSKPPQAPSAASSLFGQSLAIRVVSTGCSACDLELAAAGNPIFDMDRFGVSVVASPRFADALVVTGPVPKAMHDALVSCYEAMPEPRIVIAFGTCAISGGVHKHGYAEANGVSDLLPVDVMIPGCPPHPWQLLQGVQAARKLKGERSKA